MSSAAEGTDCGSPLCCAANQLGLQPLLHIRPSDVSLFNEVGIFPLCYMDELQAEFVEF